MIITDTKKTVMITIRTWDEDAGSYGCDWSAEYYGHDGRYNKTIGIPGLDPNGSEALIVPDVDYCIDMALDTSDEGASCDPDVVVDVDELKTPAFGGYVPYAEYADQTYGGDRAVVLSRQEAEEWLATWNSNLEDGEEPMTFGRLYRDATPDDYAEMGVSDDLADYLFHRDWGYVV